MRTRRCRSWLYSRPMTTGPWRNKSRDWCCSLLGTGPGLDGFGGVMLPSSLGHASLRVIATTARNTHRVESSNSRGLGGTGCSSVRETMQSDPGLVNAVVPRVCSLLAETIRDNGNFHESMLASGPLPLFGGSGRTCARQNGTASGFTSRFRSAATAALRSSPFVRMTAMAKIRDRAERCCMCGGIAREARRTRGASHGKISAAI